jgi:MFS family permease
LEPVKLGLGRLAGGILPDTRPVAIPSYRRLLIGQGTAFIGSIVTQVAVPVQVYALTRSTFDVGLVGLCGLLPVVGFGLYGGAIADAVDRRLLYFYSSLITWAVTLLLLLQTLLQLHSLSVILVLVVVQGAGFATASASRGALIPRIVPPELVPAANTLSFTVGNAGSVLGPLVAGVLIQLNHGHGYGWAYAADALLFTTALYSTLRLPPIPPLGGARRANTAAVLEGLRFVVGNPILLMSFFVDIAAMVLAMPRALFPEAADVRFGGAGLGPLYAAISIGSVIAGLSSGWIGKIRRQGVALTVAVLLWCVAIGLAGLSHHLWLVVLLLAVAGGADLVSATFRQTILQTFAPDELRGRMQGVFTAVVAGGPRLGDLRAGIMASLTTLTIAWSASAVVCGVLVLATAVTVRSFWTYTPPGPGPVAEPALDAAAGPGVGPSVGPEADTEADVRSALRARERGGEGRPAGPPEPGAPVVHQAPFGE